jgi:hypothetical protein
MDKEKLGLFVSQLRKEQNMTQKTSAGETAAGQMTEDAENIPAEWQHLFETLNNTYKEVAKQRILLIIFCNNIHHHQS